MRNVYKNLLPIKALDLRGGFLKGNLLLLNKMFEELQTKLDSIDAVLNEELMDSINTLDISNGFDAGKDYDPEELRSLDFKGVEALKKSGFESKYLLLEVRIEDGINPPYTKPHSRGFGAPTSSHRGIASGFLKELQCVGTHLLCYQQSGRIQQ